jgi:hypothetical protein
MIYHALKNLVSQDVFTFDDPSTENARVKPNEPTGMLDKETRRQWLADANTDTSLFSTWEGLNAAQRINTKNGNPPWKLHGLVADYDAPSPGSLAQIKANIDAILSKTPALAPQWVVTSPSGNHRLVWEFDAPLGLGNAPDVFIMGFLDELKRLLKLDHLLAGLDEGALKKPATYYDIAGIWERHNPNPLALDEVQGSFFKAVSRVSRGKHKDGLPEIPMPVVFDEIEKRFPGKWPKNVDFKDGVQGPAVWDVDAKNPRSTVYRPWGAYCFSAEDKLFRSYAEVFDKDFVRKWEANKLGAATEAIYYIPRSGYYRKWPDGCWRLQPKEDLTLYLAGTQGLSRAKGESNTPSEVENALLHIQQSKVLDGAVPIVYDRREIVALGGQQFLNIARVKVMEPDLGLGADQKWGDGFPYIAGWLWDFFAPRKQLVYFLTWFKMLYEGARNGDLRRGHAVFIVGDTNRGKTLLNAFWIPLMMGGGADAGKYLVQGEQFNRNLLEVGHWHIDDSMAATDRTQHQKFSERVKALIANPLIPYRPMYVDTQMIPFNGRVLVTLNGDPESLLMIPDLDRNIDDKLCVFRLNTDKKWSFQGNAHTENALRTESPAFLNWLINWNPPAAIYGNSYRLGMRNYIDQHIRTEATVNSFDSDLLGVLQILWGTDDEWSRLKDNGEPWVGTAAELTQIIASHSNLVHLIKGMTVRGIGMRLSKLAKTQDSGISADRGRSKHKGEPAKYSIQAL